MAALTLLEAAKTMAPGFNRGVIQTYATSYHPMAAMPIISAPSGTLRWNLEYTLPYTSGGVRNINGSWSSTAAQLNPYSENYRIYGGQMQIDRAIAATNPERVDSERASQLKAMAKVWTKDVFQGAGGTYLKGIDSYIDNDPAFASQNYDVGTASTGGSLMTDHLDKLLSMISINLGNTFIYVTPDVGLRCQKLQRGTSASSDIGYHINYSPDMWGYFSGQYNRVPIIVLQDGKGSSILSTTQGGDGACSCVYAVTYGEQMFTGFQVKAPEIIPLTQADVYNYFNLEWLVGTAPGAIRSVARLRYVADSV
jgi:hypothetical protein